jgi:hypothetical protein
MTMNISAAHGGGEEPKAKRLVQTTAVSGPGVPVRLLQRVMGLAEDALHGSLAHLQDMEWLYETQLFPKQICAFRHASSTTWLTAVYSRSSNGCCIPVSLRLSIDMHPL